MEDREYLYKTLIEELSEVIFVVSKIQRFGLYNTNPATGELNAERLHTELNDVYAMLEMLKEAGLEGALRADSNKIAAKKAKVEKYYQVSKDLGLT